MIVLADRKSVSRHTPDRFLRSQTGGTEISASDRFGETAVCSLYENCQRCTDMSQEIALDRRVRGQWSQKGWKCVRGVKEEKTRYSYARMDHANRQYEFNRVYPSVNRSHNYLLITTYIERVASGRSKQLQGTRQTRMCRRAVVCRYKGEENIRHELYNIIGASLHASPQIVGRESFECGD